MRIDRFWQSDRWHAYEQAVGHPIGERSRLLSGKRWQTRVVDLTLGQPDLWCGVRRSYHALINRLMREHTGQNGQPSEQMKTSGIYSEQGAGAFIRTAQRVHLLDAGRQTRSDASWDLMGDWLDDGEALMAMAFDYVDVPTIPEALRQFRVAELAIGDEVWPPATGFAYFFLDGPWAYYASAASLRRDVNHLLVWQALLALKLRGIRWLEMGWQGQASDPKGQAIEFFRRGFGGFDVALDKELP